MYNRESHHYPDNLLSVYPRCAQARSSFIVWYGAIDARIVGVFFYDGNLTGETYVEFVTEMLNNFLSELDHISRQHLHFLQDGSQLLRYS